MNKPASELIALADCPFCGSGNISDRHVRDGRQMFCINCGASVAPTFHGPRGDTLDRAKEAWNTRTAANQSGSERAGVDALREALTNARRKLQLYRAEHCGIYIGGVEYTQLIKQIDAALATPPAQPAPAATHGKPDGAVREALQKAIGEKLHEVEKHGWQPGETAWHRAFGYIAGMHRACDLIAALSPKIAAAEISPGDVLAMKEACKRVALKYADIPVGNAINDTTEAHGNGMTYTTGGADNAAAIAAAIDRIDVKAEAKSQEPDAVAFGMYDTQMGRSNRLMMVRLCDGQDGCDVPLYLHPTTKPEAPAVGVDAIKRIICGIYGIGSPPFSGGHQDRSINSAATAIAALISGGR